MASVIPAMGHRKARHEQSQSILLATMTDGKSNRGGCNNQPWHLVQPTPTVDRIKRHGWQYL
ncbi:MAG TPA: hypothetical protein VIQ97_04535 [Prevotella sp.]